MFCEYNKSSTIVIEINTMWNSKLENKGILSKRLLELEVFTFLEAIQFVKNLPYGRIVDQGKPDLFF